MTENIYEGLFILNSDQYARNQEEVSGQIASAIESLGGTVRVSRLWEERKLAYPIEGCKRGTYWLTYFRLDTAKVKDLNRQFQISGSIIRFLIQKIDERLEDVLVQHALAGPVRPVETKEDAPTDDVFGDVAVDVDDEEEDSDEEQA